MLFGRYHPRNCEWRKRLGPVVEALDLKADHRELIDNPVERLLRFQMLLEPGEGEFHELNPPASVGKSSGRNP